MVKSKVWRTLLFSGVVASLLSGCGEEVVLVEEEDTTKLDSLEVVIRVVEEELTVALAEEAALKRKVDSLNTKIGEGSAAPINADIVYSVQVIDGSAAYVSAAGRKASLPNAVVTVRQSEIVQQFTSDATGMVSFAGMKSGLISVTVEIEGYSDLYMIVDLRDGGDDENATSSDNRYASTMAVVFPTEGAGMFTISGNVYYNSTELNDNRDGSQNNPLHPVTGAQRFEAATGVYLAVDCIPAGILNNTGRPGKIVEAVYTGLKRTAISGPDGSYALTLPVILTTLGGNFFTYDGPVGSAITGEQITTTGTIDQVWFLSFSYPDEFQEIRIFPGGNSIQDIYYYP
ncbi:MAG TPA: hypothetical protein VEB86_08440 [Chryseosolibacter sp.]|nr:hypothetical protein [Chryseosolibacter sp.]